MKTVALTLGLAVLLFTRPASAQFTFAAFPSGLGENPPNVSPGSGYGTVVLNAASNQITVNLSWSSLTAPTTASHIHGPGGVGTNAAVLFPFSGVPATTAGAIPPQTFSINPTQVGYLFAGYLYMNLHTANFPGGEIRDQLRLVTPFYSLTLVTNGDGGITMSPAAASFQQNTVVTLTATPHTGYEFAGWSGAATGTNNPLSVTMTNDKSITGNFVFVTNSVPATIGLAAQITWLANAGFHYQVQAADAVNSNNWFDLGPVLVGNGTSNSYYDPLAGQKQRYYRVMTRP